VDAFTETDAFRSAGRRVSVRPSPGGRLVLEPERRSRFSRTVHQPVDIVFPVLHGGSGEDGGLQGLCETLGVPYVGSGVMGSSIGMDKEVSKLLGRQAGIPVVEFVAIREAAWADREAEWLDRCESELGWPVIVKPARLGSSIGIARATDRASLDAAIEEAYRYDGKVVVERAVRELREINCSVLGDPDQAVASVLEEPVSSDAVLSFRDKYLKQDAKGRSGGSKARPSEGMASLERVIPAPVDQAETDAIRDLAVRVFRTFECAGVARIDFLREGSTGAVYFNEINTIPGSLSFYLWEPSGVPFPRLVDRLLEIALRQHHERTARVRSYAVNLLSERDLGGLKGAKGS
jgi:D-alanine-D-alanine ligase